MWDRTDIPLETRVWRRPNGCSRSFQGWGDLSARILPDLVFRYAGGWPVFQLDESLGASQQLVAAYPKERAVHAAPGGVLRVPQDYLADHSA